MNPVAIAELPDGSGEAEPFPTALLVGTGIVMAAVAIGLLVYFMKHKSKVV
jgi:hypothetical protein